MRYAPLTVRMGTWASACHNWPIVLTEALTCHLAQILTSTESAAVTMSHQRKVNPNPMFGPGFSKWAPWTTNVSITYLCQLSGPTPGTMHLKLWGGVSNLSPPSTPGDSDAHPSLRPMA